MDIPQFDEFIINDETGYRFRTEDENSLADALQYAIDHHNDNYDQLKANLQRFVDREFSLDSIVAKYTDFFENL